MFLPEITSIVSTNILLTKASPMDISEFHISPHLRRTTEQENNNMPYFGEPNSFIVSKGHIQLLRMFHEKDIRVEKVRRASVSKGIL
jgi:hypothetical protein